MEGRFRETISFSSVTLPASFPAQNTWATSFHQHLMPFEKAFEFKRCRSRSQSPHLDKRCVWWIIYIYICDLIFRINSLEEIQVAKTEAQKLQASRTIAQTRVVVVRLQMLACSQAENFLFNYKNLVAAVDPCT